MNGASREQEVKDYHSVGRMLSVGHEREYVILNQQSH